MIKPENLTLTYSEQHLPRPLAEEAGMIAYRYFVDHTEPRLSPLAILSYAIRHYNHNYLDAYDRKTLTDNGFLSHGGNTPLRQRLRLPGVIALSLVVPEIEDGTLVGEHLEEPFREDRYLEKWYKATHPNRGMSATPLSWIKKTS